MTPAQHVIRSKNKEIWRSWNRARFRRLAKLLQVTEGELADMAYINGNAFSSYIRDNQFPMPVAGHLENIERYFLAKRVGETFEDTGQDYVLKDRVSK